MATEDFEQEHRNVLDRAHFVYVARSKTRGQMWLETTVSREFDMIEEKLARAKAAFSHPGIEDNPNVKEEFEDSLIDLINFAAFAVKKVERGKVL